MAMRQAPMTASQKPAAKTAIVMRSGVNVR